MTSSRQGWPDLSLLRGIYQPLVSAVFGAALPKLRVKYTEGYDERRGEYSAEKLKKLVGSRPLWVHAVSVGEVQAAVPLIRAARRDGFPGPVILSTTTETGKTMAKRLGEGAFDLHIYYPWDKKKFVQSALDSINPLAFVTMETELWPNMLWELRERRIPSFLTNGRISDRTYKKLGGALGKRIGREIFSLFTALYLRTGTDKKRLLELGIAEEKLFITGDGKIDSLLERKNSEGAEGLGELFGPARGPVFIAGSTHQGEERVVIDAFLMLKKKERNARLVIAPRHPERAAGVKGMVPADIETSMFSEPGDGWECLVVDKIGCLFGLYSMGTAAFVGGSLVAKGGQNILEPAVWGVPFRHGPHMEDFSEASDELIGLGLAGSVENAGELAEAWLDILRGADVRDKYRQISSGYFREKAGASRRAWNGIKERLER